MFVLCKNARLAAQTRATREWATMFLVQCARCRGFTERFLRINGSHILRCECLMNSFFYAFNGWTFSTQIIVIIVIWMFYDAFGAHLLALADGHYLRYRMRFRLINALVSAFFFFMDGYVNNYSARPFEKLIKIRFRVSGHCCRCHSNTLNNTRRKMKRKKNQKLAHASPIRWT